MNKKELAKKLYLLSLKGLKRKDFLKLSKRERAMLYPFNKVYKLKTEFRKLITVVLTGGVFDIIHAGHLFTLNEAKKYGDVLVVSVALDSFILRKGRKPIHTHDERVKLVSSLRPVDIALKGRKDPTYILRLVKPDVIVYGYDQSPFLRPDGVKIVMLKNKLRPHYIKSSKILHQMGWVNGDRRDKDSS